MPDVMLTVVIPTHNLLEDDKMADFNLLIDLLDLQTLHDMEVVVIDKSSKDGSVEVLKNYKNKGFFSFYSQDDNSKFEAYNKALMYGKGKYFMFLSCDDFVHDITALKTCVDLLEQENADLLMSTAYVRHPDDFVFEFKPSIYTLFQVLPCMRQSMMFRKSAIAKAGYFDEKFHMMADYDLIIRLIMSGAKPIIYDRNIVTCHYNETTLNNPDKVNEEFGRIFFKNYRNLYKMTDEVIKDIVDYSHFPLPLLEKLAGYYPPQDKEYFLEYAKNLENTRREAIRRVNEGKEQTDL